MLGEILRTELYLRKYKYEFFSEKGKAFPLYTDLVASFKAFTDTFRKTRAERVRNHIAQKAYDAIDTEEQLMALDCVKYDVGFGYKITRKAWGDKSTILVIKSRTMGLPEFHEVPGFDIGNGKELVVFDCCVNTCRPLTISDIYANDWMVVE